MPAGQPYIPRLLICLFFFFQVTSNQCNHGGPDQIIMRANNDLFWVMLVPHEMAQFVSQLAHVASCEW